MTSQRWMLAACVSLASVFWTAESLTTMETQKYTCKTYGSGVVKPYNGSLFYLSSNCPFTLTRFTHNRVECDIAVRRDDASGLLVHVEVVVNKVRTVLHGGAVTVESRSVSLPYDHTYQHIFAYGIYERLRSAVLPLTVTWHAVPGGIDVLWVELDQELTSDMSGLCGKHCVSADEEQLITESVLAEDKCQIRDPLAAVNTVCRHFFSYTLDCLQAQTPFFARLCELNVRGYEASPYVGCAFYKEVALQCGRSSYVWDVWRTVTDCAPPTCPGELVYVEQGAAFAPTCSSPNPRPSGQDVASSCVCPGGEVLDDHGGDSQCVKAASCPCVFAGRTYSTGDTRSTKCQTCLCVGGKWSCSENLCPPRCQIEGQFVTTFDGKQYAVPGRCSYVASQGPNWMILIEFEGKGASLKGVMLQLYQEVYVFARNLALFGNQVLTELHQSDHALVFWQSSMYIQVHTSFGLKVQVQVYPEVQLYVTPPANHTGMISGLCGNGNGDTTDDFTTSSGIGENSAQAFALSWSLGACSPNIPPTCSNTDNEIFADEKCSALTNPAGVFAECHQHVPVDQYRAACVQRTCNCASNLQQCLCGALGSYAKACTGLGVQVGDWRKATNCTLSCPKNLEFSSQSLACNRTCRSLSGPDPCCGLSDDPVEGCTCPAGTHLNQGDVCTPKAECACHHRGGTTPPGPVVIDGRQCVCKNGELRCSKDCGCSDGKVCFHCFEYPVNTALKTCDSLSKPLGANKTCVSGCYCPHDQYEDHLGNCVFRDNCTCVYSGKVFRSGQQVKTSCKTCVCGQGQWHCRDEPCPGTCQVYGNGHYQTFDSKWYRFSGHCQYTLVEDRCGTTGGTFSVRAESVPCCDEALTCSRSIVLDLQGACTLTLSDMRVTRRVHPGAMPQQEPLYSVHNVGLYIIVSVPSRGLTLIWDKHTRITVQLLPRWRSKVCGLCGNFDSNEMNDLQTGGAAVAGPTAFGNGWKADSPPCSDVAGETFPCERHSYCSAWAQRRCMIITGDTFKGCHLKVDPEPYYHACVQESCSCEFEGKFLGFCTAVAAYAEACSDQDVCVDWRTPDLCPVYCDYYNEQGQCSWHYEACGKARTCGKGNSFNHRLEGCYPRCPKETPYYDENTEECTTLRNCSCFFNDTFVPAGTAVNISSVECHCLDGTIHCRPTPKMPTLTPPSSPTALPPTQSTSTITTMSTTTRSTTASTATETTALSTTTPLPTTIATFTTATWPTTTVKTTVQSTTSTTPTATSATSTTDAPTTSVATAETTEWPTTTKPTTSATSTTTAPTTSVATTETTEWPTTTTPMTTNATSTTAVPTTPLTTTQTTELSSSTTPMTTSTTSTTTAPTTSSTTLETTAQSTTTTPVTTNATSTTPLTTIETTELSSSTTPVTTVATSASAAPTSVSTTTEIRSTEQPTTRFTTESTTSSHSPTSATTPPTASTSVATETWTTGPDTTTAASSTTAGTITTELTPSPSTGTASTEVTSATAWPSTTAAPTEIWPTSPNATPASVPPSTVASATTENWSTTPTVLGTSTETHTSSPSATSTTTPEPSTVPTVATQTPLTGTPTGPVTSSHQVFTTQLSTSQPSTTTAGGFTNATTAISTFWTETSTEMTTTEVSPTTARCFCKDLLRKQSWPCGETWTEDCFVKSCVDRRIELTPVDCPEPVVPTCPRGRVSKVQDECCEAYKCDCQCELYGDPHYISFQGVAFDFLDKCTYTLVEERSPRHDLTVVVDNFFCVPGLEGSCAKGVILTYHKNVASLSIVPELFTVQATLNNVTIQPPYEELGFRFETTGYMVSIYLPEIRSHVSLTPSYTLVVNLAMEHFLNNTQGQCGVCGGSSCIRKGGQIEDDSCCDKTSYDWVVPDPSKPDCAAAPTDVPCFPGTTLAPPFTDPPTTSCPATGLCDLLHHPVFENCSRLVNLNLKKKNCEFDSCRHQNSSCSSLEQAAEECKKAGFCIDWRKLTNGSCDVACPEGLVYRDCRDKLDSFCYGGLSYPAASNERTLEGCFCPHGLIRAGNRSNLCVAECPYCKGPRGEPKLPGEVWQSDCMTCKCDNRTRSEVCVRRPPGPAPVCGPGAVLVNTSCCGEQACVQKYCHYQGKTYGVGDNWRAAEHPCRSFSCGTEGIQTETVVCPRESCPEENRVWDDHRCCFTCNRSCAPMMQNISFTVENCTTVVEMPVCQGHCESLPRMVLHGDLQIEQDSECCRQQTAERRWVTLRCHDLTTRQYTYKHTTSCQCRACKIWR